MPDYQHESLSHDPLHGYIPFISGDGLPVTEIAEQHIIDHPWVQRMRQIHQLQTAWYVYPSAEHSRFEHILGVMHVASRAVDQLYESLHQVCSDIPSRAYVETLMRMAGLLHDVGHGPFGHFFDDHFLSEYGLTHETLGGLIITQELGPLLRGLRRNPKGALKPSESIDPEQVAFLITRPPRDEKPSEDRPRWLRLLRSLFSGLYTVDNMDFVLRDAYMSGYSVQAFDLDRLLHYSFYSEAGLTIHVRGLPALVRFLTVRAELFRSIYFHRTVRALDLTLAELFAASRSYLFPGDPRDYLAEYQDFTEWSLLVDVARWSKSADQKQAELGDRWRKFLNRKVNWKMACERTLIFGPDASEQASIFQDADIVEKRIRALLPKEHRGIPLKIDLPRHLHRPGSRGSTSGQNFLHDPALGPPRALSTHELYRQLPVSFRLCRIYVRSHEQDSLLAAALDRLVNPETADDKTNM